MLTPTFLGWQSGDWWVRSRSFRKTQLQFHPAESWQRMEPGVWLTGLEVWWSVAALLLCCFRPWRTRHKYWNDLILSDVRKFWNRISVRPLGPKAQAQLIGKWIGIYTLPFRSTWLLKSHLSHSLFHTCGILLLSKLGVLEPYTHWWRSRQWLNNFFKDNPLYPQSPAPPQGWENLIASLGKPSSSVIDANCHLTLYSFWGGN